MLGIKNSRYLTPWALFKLTGQELLQLRLADAVF